MFDLGLSYCRDFICTYEPRVVFLNFQCKTPVPNLIDARRMFSKMKRSGEKLPH